MVRDRHWESCLVPSNSGDAHLGDEDQAQKRQNFSSFCSPRIPDHHEHVRQAVYRTSIVLLRDFTLQNQVHQA